MNLRERYDYILSVFERDNPQPQTELKYGNPFQLLVAVILSAQCTDKRVNMITPALFAAYPTAKEMSAASVEDIFHYIKSISYPNAKATYLHKTASLIYRDYGNEVPLTLSELTRFPGVGRKTANVITSVLNGDPNMAVDTHVYRVSHRLGLASERDNTPLKVEKKLTRYIPKDLIYKAHHWLILHGRYVCMARNPHCGKCFFFDICKYRYKNKEN